MLEDPGNERPFAPPPSRTAPTLLIALAMGVMAFAGYRAMDWWSVRPAVRPAPQEMAARAPSEMGSSAPLPVRRPPADGRVQADASRIEAPPAWTRCEAGGKVSYSDTGCGGGAQKSNAHTTQAAVTTVPTNRSSGTTTLYRCKAYSGVVFWSSAHCHRRKALVDRMVEVPDGLSFQEKVGVAERSLPSLPAPAPPRIAPRHATVSQGRARQEPCEALEKTIERIDARTRQPLTAAEQDHWRGERKKARDEQFALHC
jgi:hypothetical protein